MERAPENYTRSGWIAAAALLGVLVAVSFIPPQSVGGVKFRRANILSDLVAFDDSAADTPSSAVFDEEEFHVDMAEVAERIETEVATPHVQSRHSTHTTTAKITCLIPSPRKAWKNCGPTL